MSSNRKQHGSIHRIREFELEKVNLSDEFDILQIVGEGWFGKILLVEHRATDTEMVLKALPKPYVSLRDFYREFHYGLHLGGHKNIVTTYDVAFETAGFYVFTQEYAPLGDLTSNVSDIGIGELHTKRVAKQIASALDYIHGKELVHRDIKLDNVLVYRSDFSRVKLCDFGETRKAGSSVQRRNEWLPYSPPEVLLVNTDHTYRTMPSHDIWQFGIVLFVCLTGCLPWQKAATDDPRYVRYLVWQNSTMVIPIKRTPKLFKLLTTRACKFFRKYLEPVPERRPKNLADLPKFLDDSRWLAKNAEKDMIANEPDELCASMYSFHSSPEEKNKILFALAQHGIETTVDRVAKKKRIRDWIQESVIQEDDEEEEQEPEEDTDQISSPPAMSSRKPIAGHVSSVRAQERAARKQIKTTLKDASNKHINPRTGQIQHGPSEMGPNAGHESNVVDERIQNGNENGPVAMPRAVKLVDVGSQTSNESQKQSQTPERANSLEMPTIVTTTAPTTNLTRRNSTSHGLMSAFQSLASISVPESQHTQTQTQTMPAQPDDQPRQVYSQRHNTTALTQHQPTASRSANNSINNLINDSGYGSLDKLRSMDGNTVLSSPILSKRALVQSTTITNNHNNHNNFNSNYPNGNTNSRNNLNGLSHQHSGSTSSPFHSDSGGDGSPRGSNGFVNFVGVSASTPVITASMKDTAYDRIRSSSRRMKK